MTQNQPTEEQEIANGAYLHRRDVQAKLSRRIASADPTTESGMADIRSAWKRFKRAVVREKKASDAARKAHLNRAMGA